MSLLATVGKTLAIMDAEVIAEPHDGARWRVGALEGWSRFRVKSILQEVGGNGEFEERGFAGRGWILGMRS